MNKFAPIALFVYNRLKHTKQTVEALKANKYAKKSKLFIYSDGYKNEFDKKQVLHVREYLKSIDGFKSVDIVERKCNIGLAKNIISGITKVVNKYGKIIVVEDDIVTSPYFLKFMNEALEFYEKEKKIWHIGGWNYPISTKDLDDIFASRIMNCWGWATWQDRWNYFEKKPEKLIKKYMPCEIKRFDIDGYLNLWEQVLGNYDKKVNSWAVFWYESIFKHHGLCINISKSLVKNIGFDGSGLHSGVRSGYNAKLSHKNNFSLKGKLKENEIAVDRIKLFLTQRDKQNASMTFSKNLNKIFEMLLKLKQSDEEYILYGAGTGCQFVSKFLNIEFIVDKDTNKQNNKSIFGLEKLSDSKNKILISAFGRADLVTKELIGIYKIDKKRIISLDIF